MAWQSPYNWMSVEHVGKVVVVKFTTRSILEERIIRLVGQELYRLVEKLSTQQLVLDFTEVKNLSSFMLSTLVELNKKIKAVDGRLALCSIDAELLKVFAMTRLNQLFSIYPDESEAVQSFT
jgi:anti-sigma B factor antagonist